MKVTALKFENYRNLKNNIIQPCDGVNIIYGDNAQGKTNLLEALWLFCGGHSFRTSKDNEVINWNKNFAKIEVKFFCREREQKAKLTIQSGKKKTEINGVEKSSSASLIEKYCAVVFSPEHLNLIKRGPSERRKFVDSAICREKLSNAVIHSKYNRLLNQRNSLLKDIYKKPLLEETLEVWDEPLIKYGSLLIKQRIDYIKMLSELAGKYHKGISKNSEDLKIKYISSADISCDDDIEVIAEKLSKKFEQSKKDDIRTGVTNFGAHRDDIEILINNRNAKAFASQGQQRSAVLSLKLAESAVLASRMGEKPIVLLDDVLSELDAGRQDFLLNELNDSQVFITCCEKSNKEQLKQGKIFYINNGEIADVSAFGTGHGD